MANLWVLLAACWYLQHSITFTQGQHIPETSLESNSLNPSTLSASYDHLSSTISISPEQSSVGATPTPTGKSAKSSTKKSSKIITKEILLSGTYYHENPSPTVALLSGSNETTTNFQISTLTDLNETRTDLRPHRPTNTQPCNLHVEFCGRSYGNITYVGAHNSPFTRENSAAANQHLDTTTQLNDGIRMRMYYSEDQCND